MAALTLAGLLFTACGAGGNQPAAQTSEEWGPLAVEEPSGGVMQARMTGTLRLAENCALLDTRGEDLLLVWPADRTTWDARDRTVTLENLTDDEAATAGDGDAIVLGGGSVGDDSPSGDWVARVDWVSPPDSSCPTGSGWVVGQGLREWDTAQGTPAPELGELSVEPSSGPVRTEVTLEGERCWPGSMADHTNLAFGNELPQEEATQGADDLPDIPTDDEGRFRTTYVIPEELPHGIQGEGGGPVEPGVYAFWSHPPRCSADFEVTAE